MADDRNGTTPSAPSPQYEAESHSQVQWDASQEPDLASVFGYLLYGVSLPERALRSSSAMLGGVLQESTSLLVPQAFRSSKSYSTFVQQMLDFLVKDVGRVQDPFAATGQSVGIEQYVARKAVGSFIEMAALPLLHVSPMTVLAIISDVAYGSQSYLKELSEVLKEKGIIDQETTIDHATDLLKAIQATAATSADAIDTPPLSVAGLEETLRQVVEAVASIDPSSLMPQSEVNRLWNEMHELAAREHVSMMDVSSTMTLYTMTKIGALGSGALSTVEVAGNMFDRHILDHYANAIHNVYEKGMYATLAESSKPYIRAMWRNFSSESETLTEDILTGRLIGRAWSGVREWFTAQNVIASRSDEAASDK